MSEHAVELESVTYTYRGADAPALERVTLRVGHGERLGILGPNGGGKSTLLKLILGLVQPQSGTVRVLGSTPAEARRARLVGYVSQRVEAELNFPLSARQVVCLGASLGVPPWRSLGGGAQRAVEDAIEIVGARAYADKHIGSLSGGQVQRVMIARALAARPKLLLLDEPTIGIDPAGQQQFAGLLQHVTEAMKLTVIVVSHDLRTITAGCDAVACLARALHTHTTPAGLTPGVLAEVFRHDVAAIFGDVHVDAHAAAACRDPSHRH
ncbi:MAG TPA: metal ABC transporter ATP-binding protein [Phycisphaerales bacterium]|nr:metal ABC transporter ATP-binding protein [Phycisphaerales bacterium]